MLDTAVATLLTGSAPVALGGLNNLRAGNNYKTILQNRGNITTEMQEGGILSNYDAQQLENMREAMAARYNLSDEEKASLTPDGIASLWAEDFAARNQRESGTNSQEASAAGINDFINRLVGFSGKENYTTEESEMFAKKYGLS